MRGRGDGVAGVVDGRAQQHAVAAPRLERRRRWDPRAGAEKSREERETCEKREREIVREKRRAAGRDRVAVCVRG